MRSELTVFQALRRRLLARASVLALRVALRPRGWAHALLAAGLIGAPVSALAGETIDLATDAELIIQGATPQDASGLSVSRAGDVNGDGIDDLIIGAQFADPNGRYDAGASYVVFGGDPGLPPTIDLGTEADVTIQGAGTRDYSGYSVSGAGDVNGDGIDDLIVGAFRADPNGRYDAGASYVVFGSDQGFPAIIDLGDPANGADLIIQGAAAYDFTGGSVSGAGDVDGDGIDDLIIGANYADPNGRDRAGASYVVFGAMDLSGTIDLADPVNGADLIIQGAAAHDESGLSVSGAGDVGGDGIDDLFIGAPRADPNGRYGAGASYVVFGTDQDFPATIDLADPVNGADVIIQGAAAYDQSGRPVSGAGDVDGDGIDDLIIGARYTDPNGREDAGASYVVFGTDQGFPVTIDLATDADVIIQGAAARDFSGNSVSGAGDISGDGIDDLIIGATLADPNGRDYAGASYVVFGADQGLPAIIDLATDAAVTIQGAAAYDHSGFSVSGVGDVDGDGIDDLFIGAPGADPNGRYDAGESYVVFGGPAAAIERLIARVEAADLPRRLERNLTRKLSKAIKNVNEDELTSALFRLRVFVDKVKRRRGKDIDRADANAWIADARAIIRMLRAQRRSPASEPPALSAAAPAG